MSGYVPQELNRFGFIPNGDPITAFCHATKRHDPEYHDRCIDEGAEPTPAGNLVGVLWSAFDAASRITVRHGDEIMHLCLYTEIAVYEDTLHLGPLTIDLVSSDLLIAPVSTAGMDFVLDGKSLRLAHAGSIVDATYYFAQALTRQVMRMWSGEVSHIEVTRDGVSRIFRRDDVRLYPIPYGDYAVRFGNLLMVRPNRGPLWFMDDGISDGINLDGVPVRIEVVPNPGFRRDYGHCALFDAPIGEPMPARIATTSSSPAPRKGLKVAQALIGTPVASDRSTGPRRGLGRPGLAQAA